MGGSLLDILFAVRSNLPGFKVGPFAGRKKGRPPNEQTAGAASA
jgi:hypothetical protein